MNITSVDTTIPLANGKHLAMTAFIPGQLAPVAQPVLFFFPGGGYGRGYFDIQVPGFEHYSQCRYHAANGFLCIAIDHLGVGESSVPEGGHLLGQPEPSGGRSDALSLVSIAHCTNEAVQVLLTALRAGTFASDLAPLNDPVAIGIGQSMGGHIVAVTQSRFDTFAAIAMLGSSFTQTWLPLKPGRHRPFRTAPLSVQQRSAQEDADLPAVFHSPDHPDELVAMDTDPAMLAPWRSRNIPAAALELMGPAVLAQDAARIRVPVLLVYGEVDVTAEPLDDVRAFRSAADLSLLLIPRMAHMHNFAPTRHQLWTRLEHFARRVASDSAQQHQS